jgi:hypothetical protein
MRTPPSRRRRRGLGTAATAVLARQHRARSTDGGRLSGVPPASSHDQGPGHPRRTARILLAGLAGCLAFGFTPGPASPATTWTIVPGGRVTLGPATETIKDTATGATITCTNSGLLGSLKSFSGLNGTFAGSIGSPLKPPGPCTGPFGRSYTTTMLGVPWHINLVSYNASSGLVHGTISHMELRVATPTCKFVLDGTGPGATNGMVKFTYSDGTHLLTLGSGNLEVYNVQGCALTFLNHSLVSLTASLPVSPPQTITSP